MKKLLSEDHKVLSQKGIEKILSDDTLSKSAKIRLLFDNGFDIKTISQYMNVRYNFVYNVCSNYININDIETVSNDKVSKKDRIIELYLENKSNKEISIELKTNYNYVFNTIKEYKSKLEVSNDN